VLERQFAELLGRMSFDDEVLDWIRAALRESHADEKREQEAAIARLQAEYGLPVGFRFDGAGCCDLC
jgi:site-specific DNA recombinase